MNLLRILVFVVMITSLLAFQVKSAGDERTRESPQIGNSYSHRLNLTRLFWSRGGLWAPRAIRHNAALKALTGTGTPLERELVCEDLHKPGTQQLLLAISATLALLVLHGIQLRSENGGCWERVMILHSWNHSSTLLILHNAGGTIRRPYSCQLTACVKASNHGSSVKILRRRR
jgi:hypothetical protein